MRAHPELIGGEGATDTVLMQAHPGWIAKGGAEGLSARPRPTGIGARAQGRGRQLAGRCGRRSPRSAAGLGLDAAASSTQVSLQNRHGEPAGDVSRSL